MYGDSNIKITPELAQRLSDLIGVRLAAPVAPLSGEAVADLIFRAAAINRLPTTNRFFPRIRRPLSHNMMAMNIYDYVPIADVLGCPAGVSDLLPIIYHREGLSQKGGKGRFSFFGAWLPAKQLINHRRVAPRSLARSNHSKAIWHISALTLDPISHERLLDRCPSCARLLDFWHPLGVSRCFHCGPGVDLRDFPQPIVETEDEAALRFVTDLIDPESERGKSAVHDDLRRLNEGEIFMICVIVAAFLDDGQRGERRCFTGVDVSPSALARAGRAVLEWPHGLATLRDSFDGALMSRELKPDRHPLETLMRSMKIFERSTISLVRTALLLTPISGLAEKAGSGSSNDARYAPHLQRYRRSWRSSKVKTLSLETGIPIGTLFECFIRKSLPCPDSHLADVIGVDKGLLQSFDDDLRPSLARHSSSLSVRATVSTLFRGGFDPWPAVFDGLRDGRLPFVRADATSWLAGLNVEDFDVWMDFLAKLKKPHTEWAGYSLTYDEIGFHLDLSSHSVKARLGTSYRAGALSTMSSLADFRRDYVSVREIANLLVVRGQPVPEYRIAHLLSKEGVVRYEDPRGYRNREMVEDFVESFLAARPRSKNQKVRPR